MRRSTRPSIPVLTPSPTAPRIKKKARRPASDAQIMYPTNCKAVLEDLTAREMKLRLKTLATSLHAIDKEETSEKWCSTYRPLAEHLANATFIDHPDAMVKLETADCIAVLMSRARPTNIYENDNDKLKAATNLLINALRHLDDPNSPRFTLTYSLIETYIHQHTLYVLDVLDEPHEMLIQLFKTANTVLSNTRHFHADNDEHQTTLNTVGERMTELMTGILEEQPFLTVEAVDYFVIPFIHPYKSNHPKAYSVFADVLKGSVDSFEHYLQKFFMWSFDHELKWRDPEYRVEQEKSCQIADKSCTCHLAVELFMIEPRSVALVMPTLDGMLHLPDVRTRLRLVRALGVLFGDARYAERMVRDHDVVWKAWLARSSDKNKEVRVEMLKQFINVLINCPDLRGPVAENVEHRLRDVDADVRSAAIDTVMTVAVDNADAVNELLLEGVRVRANDKIQSVRTTCLQRLVLYYHHTVAKGDKATVSEVNSVTWIIDAVLRRFDQNCAADDHLVARLFIDRIARYALPAESRARSFHGAFIRMSDASARKLTQMFKRSDYLCTLIKRILKRIRAHEQIAENDDMSPGEKEAAEKKAKNNVIKAVATFANSFDHAEFTAKQATDLFLTKILPDSAVIGRMEKLFGDDCTHEYAVESVAALAALAKSGVAFQELLEQTAPVVVDTEFVRHVMHEVAHSCTTTAMPQFNKDIEDVRKRGCQLINMISKYYAHCFTHASTIRHLVTFVQSKDDDQRECALLAFANIANVTENVYEDVKPELMGMMVDGPPRLAKLSARCLHAISKKEHHDENVEEWDRLVKEAIDNVQTSPHATESQITAITTLGALLEHHEHAVRHVDAVAEVIGTSLVTKIILHPDDYSSNDDPTASIWISKNELSADCLAANAAIKCLTRFLLALNSDEKELGTHMIKMCASMCKYDGDLRKGSRKISEVDKAAHRLAAGSALISLARRTAFSKKFAPWHVRALANLVYDRTPHVRWTFATKLYARLSHVIADTAPPIEFMAIFALIPLVLDKSLDGTSANSTDMSNMEETTTTESQPTNIESAKNYVIQSKRRLIYNANMRMSQLRSYETQELSIKWRPYYYPPMAIPYAIHHLSHLPFYTHSQDVDALERLKPCIWFIIEGVTRVLSGNDFDRDLLNYVYALLGDLKRYVDSHFVEGAPEYDEHNKKLWALCDIGVNMIEERVPNFIIPSRRKNNSLLVYRRYFVLSNAYRETPNDENYAPKEVLESKLREHNQGKAKRKKNNSTSIMEQSAINATTSKTPAASTSRTRGIRTAPVATSTPMVDDAPSSSGKLIVTPQNTTATRKSTRRQPQRRAAPESSGEESDASVEVGVRKKKNSLEENTPKKSQSTIEEEESDGDEDGGEEGVPSPKKKKVEEKKIAQNGRPKRKAARK